MQTFTVAKFTNNEGFFLNGKHIKIYGACHHHDYSALGSAFNKEAQHRQFHKLKEMEVNSIHTSHNPPPTSWLDLCDEMGLMVDDEAFDMWEQKKTTFDYRILKPYLITPSQSKKVFSEGGIK